MALSRFNRRILGPASFPPTRGQDMPDPVGAKPPTKDLPADSRFVTQGWDTLNEIKSPSRRKKQAEANTLIPPKELP